MGRTRRLGITVALLAVLSATPLVSVICAVWCDAPHATVVEDCHGAPAGTPEFRADATPECAGPTQALATSLIRVDDRRVASLPADTAIAATAHAAGRVASPVARAARAPARPPSTNLALRI